MEQPHHRFEKYKNVLSVFFNLLFFNNPGNSFRINEFCLLLFFFFVRVFSWLFFLMKLWTTLFMQDKFRFNPIWQPPRFHVVMTTPRKQFEKAARVRPGSFTRRFVDCFVCCVTVYYGVQVQVPAQLIFLAQYTCGWWRF